MPSTKRKADDSSASSPSPLVAELHFTGMYQPLSVMVDDEDVHHYIPSAAFHLSLSLLWDDEHQRTGSVRGDIMWKYGLFWDSLAAIDNNGRLFWPVARQVEAVTGRVQRRHESRGVRGDSSTQSRGTALVLSLNTLRLGVIDASLSSFSDFTLRDSEQEHSQVAYVEKFERERVYTLVIDDNTPQLMEGEVARRWARTEAATAAEGQEEEGEEAEEDDNSPTHITAWNCTAEYPRHENDEWSLIALFHRRVVEEFRAVLPHHSLKALTTTSSILRKVLGEPTEGKYRAVNPSKLDRLTEGVTALLRHCGWKEEFLLDKGAQFLVLKDGTDLLLLSLAVRALDEAVNVRRVKEVSTVVVE